MGDVRMTGGREGRMGERGIAWSRVCIIVPFPSTSIYPFFAFCDPSARFRRLFGLPRMHRVGHVRRLVETRVLHHQDPFQRFVPFFVFFFFFCVCAFYSLSLCRVHRDFSFESQNLPNELPALGGTNPYPLAPTITPLVSAEFGGGPGGNNTGPVRKEYTSTLKKHNCSLAVPPESRVSFSRLFVAVKTRIRSHLISFFFSWI